MSLRSKSKFLPTSTSRKFSCDTALRGDRKIRNRCSVRWGEQVAGAGFAWASSADRVVANTDGGCSFPSAPRENMHGQARWVLKRPSRPTPASGCVSNAAVKTRRDICRLSARGNLIADTKTRRQACRGESCGCDPNAASSLPPPFQSARPFLKLRTVTLRVSATRRRRCNVTRHLRLLEEDLCGV